MFTKNFLLFLANILVLAFCSHEEEARRLWPFCKFKEGNVSKYLQSFVPDLPDHALSCQVPYYKWNGEDWPDMKLMAESNSYMTFYISIEDGYTRAYATGLPEGQISAHGGGWVLFKDPISFDLEKYSFVVFDNEYLALYGMYVFAKDGTSQNFLYLTNSGPYFVERRTLVPEEDFRRAWIEHVQGKKLGTCHDASDNDVDGLEF